MWRRRSRYCFIAVHPPPSSSIALHPPGGWKGMEGDGGGWGARRVASRRRRRRPTGTGPQPEIGAHHMVAGRDEPGGRQRPIDIGAADLDLVRRIEPVGVALRQPGGGGREEQGSGG